jgi:hypothetical protein
VAEKVLGNKAYGHIIRAFLNPDNKRVIDYGQAQSFCRAYDVNEAWLLHGIGHPFGFDEPENLFLLTDDQQVRWKYSLHHGKSLRGCHCQGREP